MYIETRVKLNGYEDLKSSIVGIRLDTDNGPQIFSLTAERLIRHFAASLAKGFTTEDVGGS